jgi:seryl-tRNA synthetase
MAEQPKRRRRRAQPKGPAPLIEQLGRLREQRKELEAQADELKKQERELEDSILKQFRSTELESVKTEHYTASRSVQVKPSVHDWDAFYRYIQETGDFSLLQKRPGEGAVKEHWDHGEEVPGVEPFHLVKLNLRQR